MMASPLPQELQEIIYGLAVASVDGASGTYFAAHTRGLRRSNDGGLTWHTVFESLDPDLPIAVTSVISSPGFQRDGRVLAGVHGAIISSCDGGASWSSSILPLPSPFISTLALSPGFEQDGIAFAGTMEGGGRQRLAPTVRPRRPELRPFVPKRRAYGIMSHIVPMLPGSP